MSKIVNFIKNLDIYSISVDDCNYSFSLDWNIH